MQDCTTHFSSRQHTSAAYALALRDSRHTYLVCIPTGPKGTNRRTKIHDIKIRTLHFGASANRLIDINENHALFEMLGSGKVIKQLTNDLEKQVSTDGEGLVTDVLATLRCRDRRQR